MATNNDTRLGDCQTIFLLINFSENKYVALVYQSTNINFFNKITKKKWFQVFYKMFDIPTHMVRNENLTEHKRKLSKLTYIFFFQDYDGQGRAER